MVIYSYLLRHGGGGGNHRHESTTLNPPLLRRYLEFKYKRRVYKTHHVDERFHRQLHAKANLKRFLGYVTQGSLDKVAKLTEKGLDPNFQVRATDKQSADGLKVEQYHS